MAKTSGILETNIENILTVLFHDIVDYIISILTLQTVNHKFLHISC